MKRNFNLICLFLFSLSLFGCGRDYSNASYQINISNDYVPIVEEQIIKMESFEKDNFLHKKNGFGINITFEQMPDKYLGHAVTDDNGDCSVSLNQKLSPVNANYDRETLRLVVLHEVGHCFGLKHSDKQSDIMHTYSIPSKQNNDDSFKEYMSQLKSIRTSNEN